MEMEFRIHDFEGPLDLLLHLIKKSKMDIMDIEIESITQQYVDFLNNQEKLNLEVSSEYLVLAAELLEIKSHMLIPNNKDDSLAEENVEDPKERLISRLLEYQAYKDITKVLHEKENFRKDIYTKTPENIQNYVEETKEINCNATLDDLIQAFQKYYQRKADSKPLNTKVTIKEITVSSRIYDIKNILKNKHKISFFELFPVQTKEYVVATFLAILEMTRNKQMVITQNEAFDDIICEVCSNE